MYPVVSVKNSPSRRATLQATSKWNSQLSNTLSKAIYLYLCSMAYNKPYVPVFPENKAAFVDPPAGSLLAKGFTRFDTFLQTETLAAGAKKLLPPTEEARFQSLVQKAKESAKGVRVDADSTLPWEHDTEGRLLSTPTDILHFKLERLREWLGLHKADEEQKWPVDAPANMSGAIFASLCRLYADLSLEAEVMREEGEFRYQLERWLLGEAPIDEYVNCFWVDQHIIDDIRNLEKNTQTALSWFGQSEATAELRVKLRSQLQRKLMDENDGALWHGFLQKQTDKDIMTRSFLTQLMRTSPKTDEEAYLWYKYLIKKHPITFDNALIPNYLKATFNPNKEWVLDTDTGTDYDAVEEPDRHRKAAEVEAAATGQPNAAAPQKHKSKRAVAVENAVEPPVHTGLAAKLDGLELGKKGKGGDIPAFLKDGRGVMQIAGDALAGKVEGLEFGPQSKGGEIPAFLKNVKPDKPAKHKKSKLAPIEHTGLASKLDGLEMEQKSKSGDIPAFLKDKRGVGQIAGDALAGKVDGLEFGPQGKGGEIPAFLKDKRGAGQIAADALGAKMEGLDFDTPKKKAGQKAKQDIPAFLKDGAGCLVM
jgi:hypothetical protein